MACTDLFLLVKRSNKTPVFREGLRGLGTQGAARLSCCLLLPAWPSDQGSWSPCACPCSPVALYPSEGSIPCPWWWAVLLQHLYPGVGSRILRRRPAEAPWFLFYSEGVKTFRRCCSRSLPACFEKYPASVKHLSVKGEEIPPRYYFLSIVLAWCGFGYYWFVK